MLDTSPVGEEREEPRLEGDFGAEDLAKLRVAVEEFASRAGLSASRLDDFVLAVNEVASNAVEHAGGGGHLTLRTVGDRLECRITDSGPGFTEEAIPEVPPGADRASGRGLWMARMITDGLSVTAGTVGAVVTVTMRRG